MIIIDRPPNFELIQAAFPKAVNPGVLFAYDGNIYNPSGANIPPALIAHENVHLKRQAAVGADAWWHKYLHDSEFRYNEELLSHIAEFRIQAAALRDRNTIAKLLLFTGMRLVAPLYNYMPPRTLRQAMTDLREQSDTGAKQ